MSLERFEASGKLYAALCIWKAPGHWPAIKAWRRDIGDRISVVNASLGCSDTANPRSWKQNVQRRPTGISILAR